MLIRRSPNGDRHPRPQAGRDRPEWVVAINRNAWSQSIGIAGRDHPVRARCDRSHSPADHRPLPMSPCEGRGVTDTDSQEHIDEHDRPRRSPHVAEEGKLGERNTGHRNGSVPQHVERIATSKYAEHGHSAQDVGQQPSVFVAGGEAQARQHRNIDNAEVNRFFPLIATQPSIDAIGQWREDMELWKRRFLLETVSNW